jgi:hypothetical protein
MSDRARLAWIVGIAFVAAIGLLAALPTFVHWSLGGFHSRELFSSTSPDGRYRIDGFVRLDFPVTDVVDPSGTLRITLRDARTGRTLDQLFVGMYEADDFVKPTIVWEARGRVQVQNMKDKGHWLWQR